MKKLKIYAAAVLAVMLLNVPLIFATEHIVVDGEATTTQTEYKNYDGNEGAANYEGGVFYVENDGHLTILENVIFSSNTTKSRGGAIYNNGTVTIKDNVIFSSNTSESAGGAIFTSKELTIGNNVEFVFNTGSISGAINTGGTLVIGNNVNFTSNTATTFGGVFVNTGNISIGTDAKFIGNTVVDNTNSRGGVINNSSISSKLVSIGDGAYFYNNSAGQGGVLFNNEASRIVIGKNAIFRSNKAYYVIGSDISKRQGGGVIKNEGYDSIITIGANAQFIENESNGLGGAICITNGTITIEDGAKFIGNKAQSYGGAIYNNTATINLIAKTNNVEFTGNEHWLQASSDRESNAIQARGGTINLWASDNADIIFNDKIKSTGNTTILNINQSSGTLPTTGKIILNEDMTEYTGTVNFYNGTIELDENGTLFGGNMVIKNSPTIDMANGLMKEYNLKNITITKSSDKLNLKVDADLENEKMTTITADSFSGEGKIKVKSINFLSDIEIDETTEPILFTESEELKDKVETVGKASSALYIYNVEYDPETGCFTFANTGENKTINLGTVASAVAASVGGYATQSVVVNQVFAGIDGKTSNKNQKSANINSSNLYVSAGDQVFEDSGKIEKGLWLRPFLLNETVKIGDTDVDNNLYGTLAGIDFPLGQDKQLSFYLGYAGSKQEVEEIKSNQTGYIVGATGMIIKDSWYAGLTANVIFNKASVDTDFGTDDIDMNMFTIGAKAGYNYNINEKWTLEPNITLMYGMVNSQSYETSQGAKIDSQNINNILVEPQVKAKLGLSNGWQPYALAGYAANLSSKPTVKTEGVELELDSIDGYVEYGLGVNKDFVGTVWSCYAQVTGRSGGRNGVAGNLGVKYKF